MKFAFNVVTLVTSLVLCSGVALGNQSPPCLLSTGSLDRLATDGKNSFNVTSSSTSCAPAAHQNHSALSFAQNEPLPWQVPSPFEGLAPVSVEPKRLFKRAPLPASAPAGTATGLRAKVRPALTQAGVMLRKGGTKLKAGGEKVVKTTKEWVSKAKTKMSRGAQKPAPGPVTPTRPEGAPATPPKPNPPTGITQKPAGELATSPVTPPKPSPPTGITQKPAGAPATHPETVPSAPPPAPAP